MTFSAHLIVLPIVLPLLVGAALMVIDERRRRLKFLISELSAIAILGVGLTLLLGIDSGTIPEVSSYRVGAWPSSFGIVLVIDRLAALMLVLTALLAIPSILIGFFTAGPMLFGTDWSGQVQQAPFFLGAIDLAPARDTVAQLAETLWTGGPVGYALHGFVTPVFWLTLAGFVLATLMYWWKPELAARARQAFRLPVKVLENKYWADDLWIKGFAGGSLELGKVSRWFDEKIIDGLIVNGTVRMVGLVAAISRRAQSGMLYHYAFVMIIGLVVLLAILIRHWR